MTLSIRIAAAALAAFAIPSLAAVTVSFPSPRYSDIGQGRDADDVKNELARYLQSLEAKYLKAGDNLWIEVIDVDLAGDRVVTAVRDYRVTRGKSDIPMIMVRYRLERDGKTTNGEDTLNNLNYQQSTLRTGSSEPLYYEKALLEGWFKERFAR